MSDSKIIHEMLLKVRYGQLIQIAIYGAKSLALGTCMAVKELYPEYEIYGFIVKSLHGNPHVLADLPVYELSMVSDRNIHILIATPENLHQSIAGDLEYLGFHEYTCMDSQKEAVLMERYFTKMGTFRSLHSFPSGQEKANLFVYMAKFHKDSILKNVYDLPEWVIPVQVGASLTDIRYDMVTDEQGENISEKNVNYCELTALYWMWRNKLQCGGKNNKNYYGLFHYRRILDIYHDDTERLVKNDIDVILPFPLLHAPNILEHHTRYLKEEDWMTMCRVLKDLQPEYAAALPKIFAQPYFYNFNILIAKAQVMDDYCSWLFPILEKIEEMSIPKGWEREDRYIGYLGENLLTLYFMYNKDKLKIAHTGCNMLL